MFKESVTQLKKLSLLLLMIIFPLLLSGKTLEIDNDFTKDTELILKILL
jgi:hypothetical protein